MKCQGTKERPSIGCTSKNRLVDHFTTQAANVGLLSLRVLRQPVGDGVVIALFRHEYMHRQVGVGVSIEQSHGNRCPVVMYRVPKKCRATGRTKTPAYLLGRAIPSNVFLALHSQRCARKISRRKIVSGLLSTRGAMAGIGFRHLAMHSHANGAA